MVTKKLFTVPLFPRNFSEVICDLCDFFQAVGAVADLVIQPYGALVAGSLAGCLATAGYKVVGGWLGERLGVHDTCGVHNLHGMPAVIGTIISIIMASNANEALYGKGGLTYSKLQAVQNQNSTRKEMLPRPHEGRSWAG